MPPHFPRSRPRWWPAAEPWPPRGNAFAAWQHRRFFFRRIVVIFGLVMFFMVGACSGLYWLTTQIARLANLPLSTIPFLAFGAFFMLMLVFASALRSFIRLARPVGDLIEAAGRVENGDYSTRVAERGPREVRALARAFNKMAAGLQNDEQQRRALLADVTHELRTPLTVIQGNLEALLDSVYPADPPHLTPILDETQVMARLIEDLRTLALAESGALPLHLESTDLGILLTDVTAAFRARADAAGLTLTLTLAPDLPLLDLDPERLREVVTNLLTNALRHTPPGGALTLSADCPTPARVRVSVADTGTGIAPADLPHIFDRFYKSAASPGSGLGLAIAKNLVEAHGGEIRAESEVGKGTRVEFGLLVK